MNTIEVPMMKEMFMEGLLNSITQNTQKVMVIENNICSMKDKKVEPIEATMLRKYLNGEYFNPIGPLTLEQTQIQKLRNKFNKSKMRVKDIEEYKKSVNWLKLQQQYKPM
jgi:hypothetical protein